MLTIFQKLYTMSKFDILVSLLVMFVCLFIAITSMRVASNLKDGQKVQIGIRVSQWMTFAGIIGTVIAIALQNEI